MVWPGRSIPPERLPSPRMLASESVFSGLVVPSTRSPGGGGGRRVGAHRRDFAGGVAAELHRHRERAAAMDAAVMSGGLAVELVHLAGAVLDVPARDRGGEHLDQNVARPDLWHRMV